MKIRKDDDFSARVEASSMNDIMFFLLLFFLIVSTLFNPSVVKLTLPNSKKVQTISKQQISLDVTKDLKYYLNNKLIPYDDLENAVKEKVTGLEDPTIVLRVDKSITIQDLVNVLQIGSDLKIKMILATQPSK
jgi:biopolymer transport protein ExbD